MGIGWITVMVIGAYALLFWFAVVASNWWLSYVYIPNFRINRKQKEKGS